MDRQTERTPQLTQTSVVNPLSTIMHFHIQSGYYLLILYSFRNLRGD
ncbi:hypothetical protein E2C01_025340 [Portunus trituberculatus]|uniref:Uncharacterized protein n=1 Tax=Portunus trituberculatus TaxID=210409 RepID=A0A5B7EEW7_PORTR|nr:hypothetical protein [Portunus trituberculatus]